MLVDLTSRGKVPELPWTESGFQIIVQCPFCDLTQLLRQKMPPRSCVPSSLGNKNLIKIVAENFTFIMGLNPLSTQRGGCCYPIPKKQNLQTEQVPEVTPGEQLKGTPPGLLASEPAAPPRSGAGHCPLVGVTGRWPTCLPKFLLPPASETLTLEITEKSQNRSSITQNRMHPQRGSL